MGRVGSVCNSGCAPRYLMAAITSAEIDTAIQTVIAKGQSFSLNGVTYTRANIGDLISLRDSLKVEEQRAAGTRPLFRGFGFSGMEY